MREYLHFTASFALLMSHIYKKYTEQASPCLQIRKKEAFNLNNMHAGKYVNRLTVVPNVMSKLNWIMHCVTSEKVQKVITR